MNSRFALAASLLALAAARTGAQAPPAGFSYQTLIDNQISLGSAMAFAPDGRLFITERVTGNIRVLANGVLGGNWATIPKTGTSGSEQGLLGIAIDPGFLTNHYVYVYYTRTAGIVENVIARLEEVGGVGTNLTVLTPAGMIPSTTIHNGGRLVFGQDGMLYAGTGDRAVSSTSQDKLVWNGKILRFVAPNLTAPADNPFATDPSFDPFVYSYGHRNQFGLTVNPVTGGVYQTENGQNTTDEINRIVKGRNYGWPTYEGPEPVPDPATFDPIATYSPTPDPTGTAFYAGNNYPAEYDNNWFFIKYTANQVQRVILDAAGAALVSESQFDDLPGNGFDVLSGPDGNLWYLTNDTANVRGADEVGRYVHVNETLPSAHVTALCNKSVGGSVTFGYTGQNGDLFFAWIGLSQFGAPIPTAYGDWWVSLDLILPLLLVSGDNRVYRGVSVNNDSSLVGVPIHTQAARIDGLGAITLTNPASIALK
jgi:glucose/arabinose dehydrogenase